MVLRGAGDVHELVGDDGGGVARPVWWRGQVHDMPVGGGADPGTVEGTSRRRTRREGDRSVTDDGARKRDQVRGQGLEGIGLAFGQRGPEPLRPSDRPGEIRLAIMRALGQRRPEPLRPSDRRWVCRVTATDPVAVWRQPHSGSRTAASTR